MKSIDVMESNFDRLADAFSGQQAAFVR